jgi:hypothetical protein
LPGLIYYCIICIICKVVKEMGFMGFFIAGIILVSVGALVISRGNTSKFSGTTGGGSRIPPDAQVRLNESVQKVAGTKETAESYFRSSNIIRPNVLGFGVLALGIGLIVLSYFLR